MSTVTRMSPTHTPSRSPLAPALARTPVQTPSADATPHPPSPTHAPDAVADGTADADADAGGATTSYWAGSGGNALHNGASPAVGPTTISPLDVWSWSMPAYVRDAPAIAADGTIYFGGAGATLIALDGGRLYVQGFAYILWTAQLIPPNITDVTARPPLLLSAASRRVVSGVPRRVSRAVGSTSVTGTPTLGPDGRIYVTTHDGIFSVASNGTILWSIAVDWPLHTPPTLGPGGTLFFPFGAELIAVDYQGNLMWRTLVSEVEVWSAVAITRQGSVIVQGSPWLAALDASNGTIEWTVENGMSSIYPLVICGDDVIYVADDIRGLAVFNGNGTWIRSPDPWISTPPACGSNGTVYAGQYNGSLVALDANGTRTWALRLDTRALESAPSVDANGTVYVASYQGGFAVAPNGTALGKTIPFGTRMHTPIVGPNTTVLVTSAQPRMAVFGPPTPPSPSPTPSATPTPTRTMTPTPTLTAYPTPLVPLPVPPNVIGSQSPCGSASITPPWSWGSGPVVTPTPSPSTAVLPLPAVLSLTSAAIITSSQDANNATASLRIQCLVSGAAPLPHPSHTSTAPQFPLCADQRGHSQGHSCRHGRLASTEIPLQHHVGAGSEWGDAFLPSRLADRLVPWSAGRRTG